MSGFKNCPGITGLAKGMVLEWHSGEYEIVFVDRNGHGLGYRKETGGIQWFIPAELPDCVLDLSSVWIEREYGCPRGDKAYVRCVSNGWVGYQVTHTPREADMVTEHCCTVDVFKQLWEPLPISKPSESGPSDTVLGSVGPDLSMKPAFPAAETLRELDEKVKTHEAKMKAEVDVAAKPEWRPGDPAVIGEKTPCKVRAVLGSFVWMVNTDIEYGPGESETDDEGYICGLQEIHRPIPPEPPVKVGDVIQLGQEWGVFGKVSSIDSDQAAFWIDTGTERDRRVDWTKDKWTKLVPSTLYDKMKKRLEIAIAAAAKHRPVEADGYRELLDDLETYAKEGE